MKRIHPLLSYAFLLGAGTIALSATSAVALPESANQTSSVVTTHYPLLTTPSPVREQWPPDLDSLKTAAAELNALLSATKAQAASSQQLGRIPPQEFYDAVGQAEQLIGIIEKARTLSDIGINNPGDRLAAIAAAIMANSKF